MTIIRYFETTLPHLQTVSNESCCPLVHLISMDRRTRFSLRRTVSSNNAHRMCCTEATSYAAAMQSHRQLAGSRRRILTEEHGSTGLQGSSHTLGLTNRIHEGNDESLKRIRLAPGGNLIARPHKASQNPWPGSLRPTRDSIGRLLRHSFSQGHSECLLLTPLFRSRLRNICPAFFGTAPPDRVLNSPNLGQHAHCHEHVLGGLHKAQVFME